MRVSRSGTSSPGRVTLQQIADATGVSRTTVCDILHRDIAGRYSYREETRERVFKAVRELGYTPSAAARQLRKGHSGRIGLMLTTEFSRQFFALVASVVERELRAREYRLQIAVTDGNSQTEHEQMVRLQEDAVEGLIVGPVYDGAELQQHRNFFHGRLPTVLFGGICGSEFDEVALDHAAARRLAAEHLLGRGHRKIGFLCMPRSLSTMEMNQSVAREFEELGLKTDWLIEYGLPSSAQEFYLGAVEFAMRWKSAPPASRPTAMICLNDEVAMIAISALAKYKIRVPQDLSLVGCDNLPDSKYLLPALTTIENHADKLMQKAVERLVDRIKSPTGKRTCEIISPTLVVRDSVLQFRRAARAG